MLRASNPEGPHFYAVSPVNLINKLENMVRIILYLSGAYIWFKKKIITWQVRLSLPHCVSLTLNVS